MKTSQSLPSGSHLYETDLLAHHLERPGFRIAELKLSTTQTVPWHSHTQVSDTFYVLDGEMRLFVQSPKEEIRLSPGQSYCVEAGRPHLVTNIGSGSLSFLVLQGIGEYDYVPVATRESK